MRICIDIDGTICHLRKFDENYKDLQPIENAAEKIQQLKLQGHYIILYTARHMRTCQGNVGKVIALQAHTLIEWLRRHGFAYDELIFGKPDADVYIDDKAMEFKSSWDNTYEKLLSLNLKNNEINS
jgi:capsule biosynthesis phosphatase